MSEAGVPIIGATGTGYSLTEGYFLPSISFTVPEAVSLLIGTDFIEQQFDDSYRVPAQAAREKMETILPGNIRNEASQVSKTMRLLISDRQVMHSKEKEYLEKIRQAILDKRKICFHYVKKLADSEGNRHSDRTAAPYGLVLIQGSWMLVARARTFDISACPE